MVGILGNFVEAAIDFGWVYVEWYLDHNTKSRVQPIELRPAGSLQVFFCDKVHTKADTTRKKYITHELMHMY